MTIDEILTQVDSMRGLAKELSGEARVFVLKACVELLGEATRLLRIEARGAKALIPTDLASSPKAETVPPTPDLELGDVTCVACETSVPRAQARPNPKGGWLHVDGEICDGNREARA
jgi:hypothetical protein